MSQQLVLFDYDALDKNSRTLVKQRTGEIRALMRKAAEDIVNIGLKLIEVKAALPHGAFSPWLEAEFEWTDRTAQRFIQVAEQFGENRQIVGFAPSALYLLAAPSTPESARQEALEQAQAGQPVTHKEAAEIVQKHKAPPVAEEVEEESEPTEEVHEDEADESPPDEEEVEEDDPAPSKPRQQPASRSAPTAAAPAAPTMTQKERDEKEKLRGEADARETWLKRLVGFVEWVEGHVSHFPDTHLSWYTKPDAPGAFDHQITPKRLAAAIAHLKRIQKFALEGE